MSEALTRLQHRVVLYYGGRGSRPTPEELLEPFGVESSFELVGVGRPRFTRIASLVYGFNVCRALKKRTRPNVFYGRHAASLLCAGRMGAPLFYEAHTPPPDRLWERVERKLFAHPRFAGLVVITSALARYYEQNFPYRNSGALLVAPDGASAYHSSISHRADDLTSTAAGTFRIGYAGSLYDGRGIEIILAIARALPDVEVAIVGGSTAEINRWRDGATENVRWFGQRAHSEVGPFLNSCDILLAPYQEVVRVSGNVGDTARWMSPLKIFEYMAAGKAIVASDLPALTEILTHRELALLVPAGNHNAWTRAVQELRGSGALRARLGSEARRQLEIRYSWIQRAKNIVNFMEPALSNRCGGP